MGQYRKKPVVIEAYQVTEGFFDRLDSWPQWLQDAYKKEFDTVGALYMLASVLMVATLEGPLTVSMNDWIIKGVKGELYPCKPDIFEATYDPA